MRLERFGEPVRRASEDFGDIAVRPAQRRDHIAQTKTRVMKAEFTRLLLRRIEAVSGDPRQARGLVYELARIKLLDQFADDRENGHHALRTLEGAIHDIERSFSDTTDASP